MEPEGSSPCSQQPTTGLYRETDELNVSDPTKRLFYVIWAVGAWAVSHEEVWGPRRYRFRQCM
jgi:hypothetical protein